jgi:heterodisulfide reductase subunit C/nitrate reductase gamma subunit
MVKQVIFGITLLITFGIFFYSAFRIIRFFSLTKPAFPVRNYGKRFLIMVDVAFGQTKIFRRPATGTFHALVFWGFCVIIFGSIEMVIDGLTGMDKSLSGLGVVYDILMASGDIFALLVGLSIIFFLIRRLFFHIPRFSGIEMKSISHIDANVALTLILLLMISLQGMNVFYILLQTGTDQPNKVWYPVSIVLSRLFPAGPLDHTDLFYEIFWWSHILLIFIFANVLPYSKHFHVFMSVPNVFLSRLEQLGKIPNMAQVTNEVKIMMDPGSAPSGDTISEPLSRFGIRDIEDISWKNYFDALACTECGRCTSVCPANITGKKLSPRKLLMDIRARMKEKGPRILKHGPGYTDNKSLLRDYITEEELWACTLCNACAGECPVNINHPVIITDMRRYLVMEEGVAPGGIKSIYSNIENNGAPWQYSPEDRLLWARELEINTE